MTQPAALSLYALLLMPIYAPVFSQSKNDPADSLISLLNATPDGAEKLGLYADVGLKYILSIDHIELGRQYIDSLQFYAKEWQQEDWVMRSQYYYGLIERILGNHSKALQHAEAFTNYFVQAGDSALASDGLFQLGNIYIKLGDFPKALSALYRALDIDKAQDDKGAVAAHLKSIGIVFYYMKKYDEAIATYNEIIPFYESLGRASDVAGTYCNIGNVYLDLKDYEKAKKYYFQALKINQENNIDVGMALDFANLAFLYEGMEKYDSALMYHLKGLEIRKTLPHKDYLARSLIGVGRGYRFANKTDLAEKYLFEGLTLSNEIKSKPMIRDVYLNLSELYANTKDFSKAYEYSKLYKTMDDSLLNEANASQINELEAKYETAQKDQQIAQLALQNAVQEQETQRQAAIKNAFIGGLLLMVLLAGAVVYGLNQRHKNQKALVAKDNEIKEINFRNQLSELELKALRAQINPHFLYNCMNSINRMILEKENDEASQYLAKFSKLVRLILENSEKPTVSLRNELALVEAYINLESLRFKGKISYAISVDETLDPDAIFLPSMVFQPFVENAIWHGLLNKKDGDPGRISISVTEDNDVLSCSIEDNGIGREAAYELQESSVLRSKSLGIKITEERLKLLAKEDGKNPVKVIDLKDDLNRALGTRVEIVIPLYYQV